MIPKRTVLYVYAFIWCLCGSCLLLGLQGNTNRFLRQQFYSKLPRLTPHLQQLVVQLGSIRQQPFSLQDEGLLIYSLAGEEPKLISGNGPQKLHETPPSWLSMPEAKQEFTLLLGKMYRFWKQGQKIYLKEFELQIPTSISSIAQEGTLLLITQEGEVLFQSHFQTPTDVYLDHIQKHSPFPLSQPNTIQLTPLWEPFFASLVFQIPETNLAWIHITENNNLSLTPSIRQRLILLDILFACLALAAGWTLHSIVRVYIEPFLSGGRR